MPGRSPRNLPEQSHEPRRQQHRRGFRSPPVTALQTARALRRLRWRLTRNTIASLLSGSRLRLSMILFCSIVFWAGLFALVPRGL